MWMINPAVMCNKHLLGEHVECHMLAGHLQRRRQIAGYIRFNLLQPGSLRERHDQLVFEMVNREMLHKSSLPEFDLSYLPEEHRIYTVNAEESLIELSRRCPQCRERLSLLSDNQEYANTHK